MGAVQLLTSDGRGCKNSPNIAACVLAQTSKRGNLTVTSRNAVTNELVDVDVELRTTHSDQGNLLNTYSINKEKFPVNSLNYGAYTLILSKKGFFNIEENINL